METLYGSVMVETVSALRKVHAKYGSVEVKLASRSLTEDLELSASYGLIDVEIANDENLTVDLKTQYGELYTDQDILLDPAKSEQGDYLERVVGNIGNGGAKLKCRAPLW